MNRLLSTLLAILIATLWTAAHAAAGVEGTWNVIPTFANPPKKVIDTDRTVYFTSGNNLFAYDKKNNENISYTIQNGLNDNVVTNIFYNYDLRCLVVCYNNGNIDILYSDGRIVNLSDIKDSSYTQPITINDVCFDGNYMFAATSFGLVKFNLSRDEVVTSGNYAGDVKVAQIIGDNLVIYIDGAFYLVEKDNNLRTFSDFKKMYNHTVPVQIWPQGNDGFFILTASQASMLGYHHFNPATGAVVYRANISPSHTKVAPYVSLTTDGTPYYMADGNLYTIALSGNTFKETIVTTLPDDFAAGVVGTDKGKESVWSLTRDGICNYAFDGEGGVTVNMDRFKPEGFPVTHARYFFPSTDHKRLYVQNSGSTSYRFGGGQTGLNNVQTAGCFDLASGTYTDVTAYPVEAEAQTMINRQNSLGKYILAPMAIAEDPNDKDIMYVATVGDGIYKIKNGEKVGLFNQKNSPILVNDYRCLFYYVGFDKFGNLWTFMNSKGSTNSPIAILPAAKLKLPFDQIKIEDWIHPDLSEEGYWGGFDVDVLFCKKSSLVFIVSFTSGLVFIYDHRNTGSDFNDDCWVLRKDVIDQDGSVFSPTFKCSLIEDDNGKVWLGTEKGIIEINPTKAMNPSSTVTRLKMPRNDGSNLADYTLGNVTSIDMTVDAMNRKWVATTSAGVYCISASGDEILYNFNTDNSPLPTNMINAIYADRTNGTIYIGTDYGVLTYSSGATPLATDYSDILVYPNPVRPDFHGSVTIKGLMDKSLVKISDAAGQVVAQGRSEGGRFSWNVCNAAGVRVPSGVYYVLVSQNASGSSAAVSKIMVIN